MSDVPPDDGEEIDIRPMGREDAEGLVRLVRSTYGEALADMVIAQAGEAYEMSRRRS